MSLSVQPTDLPPSMMPSIWRAASAQRAWPAAGGARRLSAGNPARRRRIADVQRRRSRPTRTGRQYAALSGFRACARCGGVTPRYVADVRKLAPSGERVTDKMPSNYYFAGLIHLALPNAKIIHSIRNPVDTCISCYSKLFTRRAESHLRSGRTRPLLQTLRAAHDALAPRPAGANHP